MYMTLSEERPSKIRKLDSSSDDDRVTELASATHDKSLKAPHSPSADEALDVLSSSPKKETVATKCSIDSKDVDKIAIAQPLSKNQLKKLRRKKEWEEGREYRKAKRREKIKAKKIRKSESRAVADLQSSDGLLLSHYTPKRNNNERPVQLPITLILDCDFDELMTESEMISLGSQLTRCYSDNKTAPYRAHLIISSFGGKLKQRFETILASNHLGWKGVKFTADDFFAAAKEADTMMRGLQGGQLLGAFAGQKIAIPPLQHMSSQVAGKAQSSIAASDGNHIDSETATELAGLEQFLDERTATISDAPPFSTEKLTACISHDQPACDVPRNIGAEGNEPFSKPSQKPDIVYLTSDSPHTLNTLSPYTTYVIGGLVDKNRHKGICYKRAMAKSVPTAKLPIGEYMTLQSRSVLATNHVVEIMIRWLEHGNWAKAFLQVIPKRKEAKLKPSQGTGDVLWNDNDANVSSGSSQEG